MAQRILGKILVLDGFDRLVYHALNRTVPSANLVSALKASARTVCGHYSWDELRAARHFYNTRQLIAFWKHYIGLIDSGTANGVGSTHLPLLSVSVDQRNRQLILSYVPCEQLGYGTFTQCGPWRHRSPDLQAGRGDQPAASHAWQPVSTGRHTFTRRATDVRGPNLRSRAA